MERRSPPSIKLCHIFEICDKDGLRCWSVRFRFSFDDCRRFRSAGVESSEIPNGDTSFSQRSAPEECHLGIAFRGKNGRACNLDCSRTSPKSRKRSGTLREPSGGLGAPRLAPHRDLFGCLWDGFLVERSRTLGIPIRWGQKPRVARLRCLPWAKVRKPFRLLDEFGEGRSQ